MPTKSPEDSVEKYIVDTIKGKILTMPYPQFGEYEHSMTIEKPCFICLHCEKGKYAMCEKKQFLGLTPTIVDSIIRMVERSRQTPSLYRRLAIETKLANEEKSWDSHDDSVLSDTNQFQNRIHVYQ